MICWPDMPLVVQPLLRSIGTVFVGILLMGAPGQAAEPPKLVSIMAVELERNFQALKEGEPKPYFVAYSVTENEILSMEATSGLLAARDVRHGRNLDVTIRVGIN